MRKGRLLITMETFQYVIQDELGIHARPAGLLVKEASKFKSDITVKYGEKSASAKKLMAMMAMGIKSGNEITVSCEGTDEEEAASALKLFFKNHF